jgi:hypothetical protein
MKLLLLAALFLVLAGTAVVGNVFAAVTHAVFGNVRDSDWDRHCRTDARDFREFRDAEREARRAKEDFAREALRQASEARREALEARAEFAREHRNFVRDQVREAREAARELREELHRDWDRP